MSSHAVSRLPSGISVRRAAPEGMAVLKELVRNAWPANWPYRVPERWQWLYEANPFNPDGKLPIWLAAREDDRIVAQSTAIIEPELAIANGGLDANWLCAHGIPTVSLGCGQLTNLCKRAVNPVLENKAQGRWGRYDSSDDQFQGSSVSMSLASVMGKHPSASLR